jgi:hypothetical protein
MKLRKVYHDGTIPRVFDKGRQLEVVKELRTEYSKFLRELNNRNDINELTHQLVRINAANSYLDLKQILSSSKAAVKLF